MAAVADPSLLNAVYVLPPDYVIMTETAEVFTKALLLGMEPDASQADFADTEPVEILPYEEALAYMRKRLPVDAQTYYALNDKMRYRAFTVGRLADGDAVRQVQHMLVKALDEGTGLRQFLQMTEGELADAAGMGRGAGWYYETVYRTNMATAYNAGRAIGFEETPPVALELIGIDDMRQTELCHSLTAPPFRRPYDDPVWEHLWPPFHFNCRTTVRAIYDQAEIDEAGGPEKFYSKDAPDYKPDKGFGTYPVDKTDTWWDMTGAMRERAEEYGLETEFLEAKERLIETAEAGDAFVEAQSIKEANDYAENVLGIPRADYKGCDIKAANEMNKAIYDTLQQFPELKKGLRFIGECHERNAFAKKIIFEELYQEMKAQYPGLADSVLTQKVNQRVNARLKHLGLQSVPGDTYAQSETNSLPSIRAINGITVNRQHAGNPALWEKSLKDDVFNKFHPQGTDTIKSVIDHELGHQLDSLLQISKDNSIVNLYRSLSNDELTNGLSRYSWDNGSRNKIREFVAEGWAEYRNNPNPRPIARTIGELIERKYKAWK